MKEPKDFIESAIKNNIHQWTIHNCSACGYECGYIFLDTYYDQKVLYDHGCDCTDRYIFRTTNWKDVADLYNAQKNKHVIKEMNDFWGFKD